MPSRVLACLFPSPSESASHYDACSAFLELEPQAPESIQVKILKDPTLAELQQQAHEFKPTLLYLSGPSSFEEDKTVGVVGPLHFKDGAPSLEALAAACAGAEAVFLDAGFQEGLGPRLQATGVLHTIFWPEGSQLSVVLAAQFSHTFFCSFLHLKSTIHEAFALASHSVQALCSTQVDGQVVAPSLPTLLSTQKAGLPDNSTIIAPTLPGVDTSMGLSSSVPGWTDIRLLAPRAELRLLLTGNATLMDGTRLSFLGEALRALLVLEMRSLQLVSSTPCSKTPANLPVGCTALRCEVRTGSGASVVAILGGQPSVLQEPALVEHALRMTLVADSLSLQFRLPPPGVAQPVARHSAAIAGGVPVMDALVLTSVWAVHVLRHLSLVPEYKPLISLGVAAVGGTATLGVSALDAQRLKIIVTGQGPETHSFAPILTPGTQLASNAEAAPPQPPAGSSGGGEAEAPAPPAPPAAPPAAPAAAEEPQEPSPEAAVPQPNPDGIVSGAGA